MYTLTVLNPIDNILAFLKRHLDIFDSFASVYLFGSILDVNKVPNDIDILLVYEKYSFQIKSDLTIICSLLENEFGIPVDLTTLSIAEEKDIGFLHKINHSYYKLK